MTDILLNEPGLDLLLNSEFGPVGILLAAKADLVAEKATQNASGDVIGVRTGDLRSGIKAVVTTGPEGLHATVGTDATHRGFGYPAYWDQNGRPWLTRALEAVFA